MINTSDVEQIISLLQKIKDSSTNGSQDSFEASFQYLLNNIGRPQLEDFDDELTFDRDKDLATVDDGGTVTFTLATSGHLNGVGIIARINEPTAVNFPAEFEMVNGSDSIVTDGMNIIVMRYYENYDGAGTGKVLYVIKNQTALA